MEIIAISKDTGERYTEVFTRGDQVTDEPAPLLAVYEMQIAFNGEIHTVMAEVRRSAGGEQIDWDDELYFTNSEGCDTLNSTIHEHFSKKSLKFPIGLTGGQLDKK